MTSLPWPLSLIGAFVFVASISANCEELDLADIDPSTLNQIIFEDAITLMNEGRYGEASEILTNLYKSAGTQRIKLELARSLYLSGQKKEADVLFEEINDENIPMMVREKINIFRGDIALSKGKLDLQAGVIYDTNPRAISGDRVVNIFGLAFDYRPGFSTKPHIGLNYVASIAKGLDDKNQLVASASISGNEFSDSVFNKMRVNGSISYRLSDYPNLQASFSYEEYFFANKLLYTSPTFALAHSLNFDNFSYWNNEVKYSTINYPDYKYLAGPVYDFRTTYGHLLTEQLLLEGYVGYEKANSNEASYSYESKIAGVNSNLLFPDHHLKVQAKFSTFNRNYEKSDPLFGEVRKDTNYNVSLTLNKTNWKVLGMLPTVDLLYEENKSDIAIYSYERAVLSLNLFKQF